MTTYAEALAATGREVDERLASLTRSLAQQTTAAADARAAQAAAEQRTAAADQLVAQLRAELAAMNAGQRPQVLVPGFTDEVFYDPFTSIDDSKWNVHIGTLGAPREEYCRRENLRIVPQGLAIEARREAFGGRSITSGYLRSDGKAEFGFGHLFEVEATFPILDVDASGLWVAPLWLRSKKSGEIDGPEAYGFPNVISDNPEAKKQAEAAQMRNSMACTVHNDTSGGPNKVVTAPAGGTIARGSRHRYGILVDDAGVTHFLDGEPVVDTKGRPNPLTWAYLATKGVQRASFDAPLHMRIQLQVGSPYWGPSRPTTKLPATLLVHWVRVTRKP